MRCISYASAAQERGCGVVFAVTDDESRVFLEQRGWIACVLPGDCLRFGSSDGLRLAEFAAKQDADAVLVDSYAVTGAFFDALRNGFSGRLGYIDDLFSFEGGHSDAPVARTASLVINYSFGVSISSYESVYRRCDVDLLMGPAFAPVRSEFVGRGYQVSESVETILVTCGATNPERTLERMAQGCVQALPSARVIVVVGPMASFDEDAVSGGRIEARRNVSDMSSLMLEADVAVSAAGSTLYELAALGVPTIAVPITENQLANARGVAELQIAATVADERWGVDGIADAMAKLREDTGLREAMSARARQLVDGRGVERVASALALNRVSALQTDAKGPLHVTA